MGKLETQLDLNDNLKAMGITDMFDENKADFSKMRSGGKKDLYVSKVVQKAFIEVNEDGTEAAAATAGVMMMRAMVINPSFTCDRPFMFMIRDNLTGVTLFSGRFSHRIYIAYSTVYTLGTLLSMQISFVGFQPVQTSEHMLALGVFGLCQILSFVDYLRANMTKEIFNILFKTLSI